MRPRGVEVTPPPYRLELRGITKRYPGIVANDDVSLAVRPGEIHAVLGENGAGKSTLMKIIFGAAEADAGTILWNGEPATIASPAAARRLGIGMVYQHFSLFESVTVAENIAVATPGKFDLAALSARIRELSQRYGLPIDPNRLLHHLSVGERQRVEIIRCLLQNPKLLILDEPTSVLPPQAVRSLFTVLRKLAAEGCSILYISHKLDEIRELCDGATVLRAGRVSGTADPRRAGNAELARLMVGAELPDIHRDPVPLAPGEPGGARMDEDCLFLNVVRPSADPSDGRPRPVMVWLHGGAYAMGSSSQLVYHGDTLAVDGDVVVVTLNYRLGALGFLDLRAAGLHDADTNPALRDVLLALTWVRENIAAFGGDPGSVTVFGQSAGAGLVIALLASPAASGLFHRAIAQSPPAGSMYGPERSAIAARSFLEHLSLAPGDGDELRSAPVEAIVDAGAAVYTEIPRVHPGTLAFAPGVGDDVLPESPLRVLSEGRGLPVPLIVGTNVTITYNAVSLPAKNFSLDINNNFEDDDFRLGSFYVGDLTAKRREVTASFGIRESSSALWRQATYGVSSATQVGGLTTKNQLVITCQTYESIVGGTPTTPNTLTITIPKFILSPYSLEASGDDIIESDIEGQAVRPAVATPLMTVAFKTAKPTIS